MKETTKRKLPGLILTIVHVLVAAVFMWILHMSKLLPDKYLIGIGGVLILVSLLIFLLTESTRRKVMMTLGSLLTVIMVAVYLVGGVYLGQGISALSGLMGRVELADIGVYVLQEDEAKTITDAKGYTFGILETLDRENTDHAIAEINDLLGEQIATKPYAGFLELAQKLLDGEVDVIILNTAFLDLLAETEGYQDIEQRLREIHIEQVEQVIQNVKDPVKNNGKVPEVFSVYISGIDSRSGLIAKSRSDVNIIATVNTKTRQVLLTSTPRDYYVPLSISGGRPDKLTHAGIYGIDVSMETLELLYGIEIDYYFRVNFSGFKDIVDALGGITVVSDFTFHTQQVKGYYFVKGENYMNGDAALAFVRERYSFAEGDRQRGKHQLAVIEGIMDKAMSAALLTNYSNILNSISGSFETSMPYDVMANLVRDQLQNGGKWNIEQYSVNGTGASKVPYSLTTPAYVMIPDQSTVDTAIAMMQKVAKGEKLN